MDCTITKIHFRQDLSVKLSIMIFSEVTMDTSKVLRIHGLLYKTDFCCRFVYIEIWRLVANL